jgi:hypothetical protein
MARSASSAVTWYAALGCEVLETYDDGGDGLSFAILGLGATRLMLNQGGRPSLERRREVDLYIDTDDVDRLHEQLRDRVEIVKGAPRHALRHAGADHSRPESLLDQVRSAAGEHARGSAGRGTAGCLTRRFS